MIRGSRIIVQDKLAFREENGILRQVGKPMDIMHTLPKDVKFLHIVDLNAKRGNTTNFDLYNHMTYSINIEVEISPKEEIVRKLLVLRARAVLELPCELDLEKLSKDNKLIVGKTNGREKHEFVSDYYIETDDIEIVKKLAKEGKRVFLYSKELHEKELENAGVFALIKDY